METIKILKTKYFVSDKKFSYALTNKSLRWRFFTKNGIKEVKSRKNLNIQEMVNYFQKIKEILENVIIMII